MECFDENAIEAWLQHTLPEQQQTACETHLDECVACRELIASCLHDTLIGQQAKDHDALRPRHISDDATLEAPTQVRMAPDPEEESDPRPGLLPSGTMIGQFCTMSLLGRGGMADVYLARDTQLGRQVALKWFDSERFASSKDKERCLRVARTTAMFTHPNHVPLSAAGENGDGPHAGGAYVALEFIRGSDLRSRLQKGPLAQPEAITIGLGIGNALIEAHRRSVLHCDLKPGNVMLGRHGTVRVVDFGLAGRGLPSERAPSSAGVFGAPDSERAVTTLSRNGSSAATPMRSQGGSPRYMAPEQWWDDPCSDRTDIWAAGLIMYEMMSGQFAFDAEELVDLASQITSDNAAPALKNGPQAVIALVAKCLDKEPMRRPDAKRFVERLEAL